MNAEVKPRHLSLSMFLEHDQTLGKSVSNDFSNLWVNGTVVCLFDHGTQMVIKLFAEKTYTL